MAGPPFYISVVFVLFLVYKLYQRLRFNLPPGPRPWPITGNLHIIEEDRIQSFEKLSKIYGRIISVWFGSTLNVIVSSAELAKEVLKDKDQQLANRHRSRAAEKVTKNGAEFVWADYGPHYVKMRRICNLELFSPKRIEVLRPIREDEVRVMIESVYNDCVASPGRNLLLRKYLGTVAFNNITRLVLGRRFMSGGSGDLEEQGLEFKAIVTDENKLGASHAAFAHVWWLSWIFSITNGTFLEHLARRDRLTRAIIEEHRAKSRGSGHFVDVLLSLQAKQDITEDTMIGLLWNMITAGMDTIAITVEWAMAELVKHPRVQNKAQEELDRVIGSNRTMVESDLGNLLYLQCVVKEALRLHPPTPLMLPHKAGANVKLGGYDIPKGTTVYVNVMAIARDPAIWQDPLEFRPERFLEDDVDLKGHDFRLLPFGSGRRICPAVQLSLNLVTSMIGHLLRHFSWTLPDGVRPEDIDMSETPALVNYMKTPLQAVPLVRLPPQSYKHA